MPPDHEINAKPLLFGRTDWQLTGAQGRSESDARMRLSFSRSERHTLSGTGFAKPVFSIDECSFQQTVSQMSADIPLSLPQIEVLRGIACGLSAKEIALHAGLTTKSVDSLRYRLMQRLEIHNRIELTRYAIEHGYVDLLELPTTPEPSVLSDRQREVVALTADGLSTKEMAELLEISTRSADAHKHRAMYRLDIHDAVTLVHYCAKHQLTPASRPDAVPLEPPPPKSKLSDDSAHDSDESPASPDE